MYLREFKAHVGSRVGAIVFGLTVIVFAGVFLAFGLVLILGLIAMALFLGVGAALYHRLGGSRTSRPNARSLDELDPSLEVSPAAPALESSSGTDTRKPPDLHV